MPKNAIVLGMARSGTSLTASIFAHKGYYASTEEDIVPADNMNPTGYWEAESLISANVALLQAAGFSHHNTWIFEEITEEQVNRLDELELNEQQLALLDTYNKHSPWVWKDLRLCYTLGIWWPHIDHSNTAVILVKRDYEAIFHSFVRVGWRRNNAASKQATFRRIRAHIENAEKTIAELSIPHIAIDYSDYKKRPEKLLKDINSLLDLDLSTDDLNYKKSYDHSSLIGRFTTNLDGYTKYLSPQTKQRLRKITPYSLLRLLYPERYR